MSDVIFYLGEKVGEEATRLIEHILYMHYSSSTMSGKVSNAPDSSIWIDTTKEGLKGHSFGQEPPPL